MDEKKIVWHEPEERHGGIVVRVEGLSYTAMGLVYGHPLVRGNPVFPHPDTGKAYVTLDSVLVAQHGATRCWWWLREDVTEKPVLLSRFIQDALADALEAPNPYEDGRWDEGDPDDLAWVS